MAINVWVDYLRGHPTAYEEYKQHLLTRKEAYRKTLEHSGSWEDAVRLQGKIHAIDDLLHEVTSVERQERDAAERAYRAEQSQRHSEPR